MKEESGLDISWAWSIQIATIVYGKQKINNKHQSQKNKTKHKTHCNPKVAPGVETGHVEVGGDGHPAPLYLSIMSGDRASSLQTDGLRAGLLQVIPMTGHGF